MTDTLALMTAKMMRDHFHKSGMTKEVDELDKAIKAEEPKKEPEKPTFTPPKPQVEKQTKETHNG